MDNLVITKRATNQRKNNRTPWQWLTRDEGKQVDAHLSAMHWNKQKREYFCRQETDCPQWDNTTRMAQLARHLRTEIIRWLGIRQQSKDDKQISNEMGRRIGTPTGFMTGICREAWAPPAEFPKMYREIIDKQGRTRWIKNRGNLRHHLWDAAILSHIPPGIGMNSAGCGGIFLEHRDPVTGEPKTGALSGLDPDLNAFENANADRCLVSKPRQAKSKKSRYKQTILSLPDEEGRTWARKPLQTHTAEKGQTLAKIRSYLNRPGLLQPLQTKNGNTIQLLRDQDLEQCGMECRHWHWIKTGCLSWPANLELPARKFPAPDWRNSSKRQRSGTLQQSNSLPFFASTVAQQTMTFAATRHAACQRTALDKGLQSTPDASCV